MLFPPNNRNLPLDSNPPEILYLLKSSLLKRFTCVGLAPFCINNALVSALA